MAEVPPQLWLRSGRPFLGTLTRIYVAFALIATALTFVPRGPAFWGLIVGGVLCYFLFPLVIQGMLAPLERRVLAARRRDATALLQEVRGRRLVRQFAPHAWLTLQEGRLHLRRGDGKAAARAFTETVRLSRTADAPGLISAQAHALLIADQPEQTRELLQALAKKQTLSPTDQLHLGLAMLAGKGNAREALAHVQAAEAALGPHPRVLAALALALHRADQPAPALTALQQAQDALGSEPDPFDEALIQRGVKLLRPLQKAQQKRDRKQAEPAARVAGGAAPAVAAPVAPAGPRVGGANIAEAPAKSPRKLKKEERRAARRASKAEKRTQPEPVKAKKAAKVKPTGKAARPMNVSLGGAVKITSVEMKAAPVGEAKPASVESTPVIAAKTANVETTPVAAKSNVGTTPVAAKTANVETTPVAAKTANVETTPVIAKTASVESTPVVVAKSTAESTPARSSVESTPVVAARSNIETTPVAEVKTANVATTPAAEVKPVVETRPQPIAEVKTPVTEIKPVVEARPQPSPPPASQSVAPPASQPIPPPASQPVIAARPPTQPTAAPAAARTELPRLPAPPPGKSLFGSVGPSAPGAPPRPAAPAITPPTPPLGNLPRAPLAAPVPKSMSFAPPVVAAPAVRAPTSTVASGPIPAPVAPRISAPAPVAPPRLDVPVASVRPPGAVVLPSAPVRPPGAVVLPSAPMPGAAPVAAPPKLDNLAQVLPDTDDAWDDMLNALEVDGPSTPV